MRIGFQSILGGVAIVGLLVTPAAAQDWGSTPEQVAASEGATIVAEEEKKRIFGLHRLAAATERTGESVNQVSYYFDPDARTLQMIEIVLPNSDCEEMELFLRSNRKPDRDSRKEPADPNSTIVITTVDWKMDEGDTVRYLEVTVRGNLQMCKILNTAPGFL